MASCGCISGAIQIPASYNELSGKPTLNGTELVGDVVMDAGDIGYDSSETYEDGTVGKALQSGSGGYTSVTVSLSASGWNGGSQTVTVTGVTADSDVVVSPDPASASAYTDAKILCTAQGTDSLTFSCDTAPSEDINVNVLIFG